MQVPITLPDTIQDSIIWLTPEAWDRVITHEEVVAKQIELVADDYEQQASLERVEARARFWQMYD